jgi:hypothetical protein
MASVSPTGPAPTIKTAASPSRAISCAPGLGLPRPAQAPHLILTRALGGCLNSMSTWLGYPPNLRRGLAYGLDILHPHCVRPPAASPFDLNACRDKERPGAGACHTSKCRIRLSNHTKFGVAHRENDASSRISNDWFAVGSMGLCRGAVSAAFRSVTCQRRQSWRRLPPKVAYDPIAPARIGVHRHFTGITGLLYVLPVDMLVCALHFNFPCWARYENVCKSRASIPAINYVQELPPYVPPQAGFARLVQLKSSRSEAVLGQRHL